jgi:hypothetical protein
VLLIIIRFLQSTRSGRIFSVVYRLKFKFTIFRRDRAPISIHERRFNCSTIGGSLAKLVYFEPNRPVIPSTPGEDDQEEIAGGSLHFIKFEVATKLDELLQFMQGTNKSINRIQYYYLSSNQNRSRSAL